LEAHNSLQYLARITYETLAILAVEYEHLTHVHPGHPMLWGTLGEVLTRLGRNDDACLCYAEFCRLFLLQRRPDLQRARGGMPAGPQFIIGGFSKCATTSLYLYLRKHPDVVCGPKKEVRYFNDEWGRGPAWYLSHFPALPRGSGVISGEGTPGYAVTRGVEQRVAAFDPALRMIFLVRDPVARTVSHYHQRRRNGLEHRALEDVVSYELDIARCVLSGELDAAVLPYVGESLYSFHIDRWRAAMPGQILVVRTEALATAPDRILVSVCRFLNLRPWALETYERWNAGMYEAAPPAVLRRLKTFFARIPFPLPSGVGALEC